MACLIALSACKSRDQLLAWYTHTQLSFMDGLRPCLCVVFLCTLVRIIFDLQHIVLDQHELLITSLLMSIEPLLCYITLYCFINMTGSIRYTPLKFRQSLHYTYLLLYIFNFGFMLLANTVKHSRVRGGRVRHKESTAVRDKSAFSILLSLEFYPRLTCLAAVWERNTN